MNKYDGLYIFAGAAKDEALDKLVEKAGGEITRLGGSVVGTEMLGRRTFARQLKKRDSGFYVRIRFQLDPAQVDPLTQRYRLMEEIFRVQILSVDDRRERLVSEQAAKRKAKSEAAALVAAEKAAALGLEQAEAGN